MLSIAVVSILFVLSILFWCKMLHDRLDRLWSILERTANISEGNINGLLKVTDVLEKQQKRIDELEQILYTTGRLDRSN